VPQPDLGLLLVWVRETADPNARAANRDPHAGTLPSPTHGDLHAATLSSTANGDVDSYLDAHVGGYGHGHSTLVWQPIPGDISAPDASHGCAFACPEAGVLHALESLTALNTTEATERGAPLSVFSVLSGISGSVIRAFACPEAGVCLVVVRAAM